MRCPKCGSQINLNKLNYSSTADDQWLNNIGYLMVVFFLISALATSSPFPLMLAIVMALVDYIHKKNIQLPPIRIRTTERMTHTAKITVQQGKTFKYRTLDVPISFDKVVTVAKLSYHRDFAISRGYLCTKKGALTQLECRQFSHFLIETGFAYRTKNNKTILNVAGKKFLESYYTESDI